MSFQKSPKTVGISGRILDKILRLDELERQSPLTPQDLLRTGIHSIQNAEYRIHL